ncbi:MAG: nuclear transport factor 2 family protein [Flavisolibacter sp.]
MRSGLFILAVLFTIPLFSFSQPASDSAHLVNLLKEDYKTMVNWDIDKHKSFCTADYVLIEEGEIWDMAREAANYRKNQGRKMERVDHFDILFVKVVGDAAYTVYHLRSDIREHGELRVKRWNESVVFRKVMGVWKIALIHSTVVSGA